MNKINYTDDSEFEKLYDYTFIYHNGSICPQPFTCKFKTE